MFHSTELLAQGLKLCPPPSNEEIACNTYPQAWSSIFQGQSPIIFSFPRTTPSFSPVSIPFSVFTWPICTLDSLSSLIRSDSVSSPSDCPCASAPPSASPSLHHPQYCHHRQGWDWVAAWWFSYVAGVRGVDAGLRLRRESLCGLLWSSQGRIVGLNCAPDARRIFLRAYWSIFDPSVYFTFY